jgi:anti-anti-sigma regulatory factor
MTAVLPSFSARPAAPILSGGPSDTPAMPYPSALPERPITSPLKQLHGAVFSRRWLTTSVALVSAHGDVDATNASALTEYAVADVGCHAVVLDLRGLSLRGAEGFTALHRISACYAAAGTAWAILSGPAVSRLLTMCDPAGALPYASCMNAALMDIKHQCHVTDP